MLPVLFVRRGALGDTLLTLPMLGALRAGQPQAELHFAGVRDFAVLFERYGVVARALSSEDVHAWPRARFAAYGLIVADTPLPGAVVFDPRVPDDAGMPAAAVLLERLGAALPSLAAAMSATTVGPAVGLRSRRATAATPPEIVLHPGSGGRQKCWPMAAWLRLVDSLRGRGCRLLCARGPAEIERGEALLSGCEPLELDIAGLAARLETAACVVGHDAGPTHLAAALQVPTVAIFGPTDPRVWAPVGAHVRVVGQPTTGPPTARVDEVLAMVSHLLGWV